MARSSTETKMLVSEAARLIGCSAGYVRFLTDTGRLPAERGLMGIRLLDRAAVERFAAQREAQHALK
jgi:excisionase family DNA binding protein